MKKNNEVEVKVRFAPSPTGNLHIGGLRTAFFNYLFAKKYAGKFILRIDDTDPGRSKKEYENSILNDLKWFDLNWDEFYRQSERAAVYEKYLDALKDKDLIYECFCTEKDLLKSKELAIKAKKPYIYSGRCRNLNDEEKAVLRKKLEEEDLSPSIRFNTVKSGISNIVFNDLVHGNVSFNSRLTGDFILKTSGGRFTYNFASIVDDIDLDISHVIRGEDHISNTPKQLILCKSFEKTPPVFAHISLLYGKDGKLMSKRDLNSNIDHYKNSGYLPEAVLNYLAITGNAFAVPRGGRFVQNEDNGNLKKHAKAAEKEVFSSVSEMAKLFDIAKAKSSGAVFDEEKLRFINERHLKQISAKDLIDIMKEKFLALSYLNALKKLESYYKYEALLKIIGFLKNEYKTIKEIMEEIGVFYDDFTIRIMNGSSTGAGAGSGEVNAANINYANYDEGIKTALRNAIEKESALTEEMLKETVKQTAERSGKNLKDVYETLRFFLTGKIDGPSIIKIALLLGKEKVIKRLG